ncbi:M56 family metallopeptidase [Streptomyces sp. NEAU-sy36]|uniref:M56 family metallopeptidase n=1 Tax=unclassified Streptomyces TaxID=2593676 RepID=UPI0015D6417E|nr:MULTISPECIES: M56 family metallopeptidase [unclassified Streptomyces]QLJ03237.1 M56 family metallopeptidase [Streptomyces sp. NEAU-sy36]
MTFTVYVPLVVTVVLAVLAPAARRLPPRAAARSLACAALVTATGWLGSLALLAFTGLAQIPEVAEQGHWSVAALRAEDPVSLAVAALGALGLIAAFGSLAVAAVRQTRQLLWARREAAAVPGDTELTVLDDEVPQAFALPGAPGRIVVSRGMLRCLGDDERAALLAHERAHLRGRHHLYLALWRLTAAVTPLLRPLADAGGFVLERWADEDAATHVGSRTVVARAVGRAALASAAAHRQRQLAATGGAVPQRVRALLAPPPAPRTLPFVAGAVLLALCCASLAEAASDSERMVVTARSAQCATTRPAPVATDRDGASHRHPHCRPHRHARPL